MSDRVAACARVRRLSRTRWSAVMALCFYSLITTATWSKDEVWRQEGSTAFAKSHREGVVVADNGRVRLGHVISPLGAIGAERVWDLGRTRSGILLASTGDAGKVFRREASKDAAWTVLFDSTDSQALSLAVCPDDTVYVGTGPGGRVVNVTDPKHPESRPDPRVQYIWDLASDRNGELYAATGPEGQLWKRARDGKWSLIYDSKATHLLAVAIGPDGSVYAGTDGEGLIYRVGPDHKVSILFDAPQSEIRALTWGGDGALYAGTAAEAGGATNTRSSLFLSQAGVPQSSEGGFHDRDPEQPGPGADDPGPVLRTQSPPELIAQTRPPVPRSPQGGSAAPRPISPGDNAVYRIDSDAVPREVLRVKSLVHALVWSNDRLLVGTGPEGLLYEVRSRGEETAPIVKLDHGQILALLAEPDGAVLIGTGDPGSVVQLVAGHSSHGALVSEVHDTKLFSRFGSLNWRGERPPGTSISLQARSGNVGDPDETWSAWSDDQTESTAATVSAPPGRFVQYRAKLATTDPKRTPELRSVSLNFRTINLAPEITRIDVPDVSAADGTARQTRLNVRWDANDPNDDEISFTLKVRKDGWPAWIELTGEPINEKTFAWDTSSFPSGPYRLKLVASDRPSNSPEDAITRERESVSFLVDHESPHVNVMQQGRGAVIVLNDGMTRLVKADYALDGGAWTPLFPDDRLFDSMRETINLSLPDLKAGSHLIMVRTTDSAGNIGSGDALIEVKN